MANRVLFGWFDEMRSGCVFRRIRICLRQRSYRKQDCKQEWPGGFCKRPELFVVNKFSNLLRDKENDLPSVRGSDPSNSEVTLDGIWVPIFWTESNWSLYWEFLQWARTEWCGD